MKKIFIVGFSNDKGGVENYVTNLVQNLNKKEVEIFLCLPEMTISGRTWVVPRNRHNYFNYCRFWKSFFRENKFDAIYYNTCDIVSIDLLKFAKKANIKIRIIHSHNSANVRKLNFIHRFFEKQNRRNINKYATHLFACSKEAGEWMFGAEKEFSIINNAIDIQQFQYNEELRISLREEIGLKDQFLLGMVARLEYPKMPEYTIEVFKELLKYKPESQLIFVGEGYLQPTIEKQIQELGLQNKIKILGRRNDISAVMSAIDCLILPSRFEGFPFVMVEAQATGLPCFVADVIPIETNITGRVTYLNVDGAPMQWAEKIAKVGDICFDRRFATKILDEKGYNIRSKIKKIEDIILGGAHN